jgi:hypothetical protein
MNQNRTFNAHQKTKELPPYFAFLGHGFRPETVHSGPFGVANPRADQIIKILPRQPFHIKIYGGAAFDFQFGSAYEVDFLLPDCQRLEGVMVFLGLVRSALGDGPERVGAG